MIRVVRIFLLALIILGVGLIMTQRLWVPFVVQEIIQYQDGGQTFVQNQDKGVIESVAKSPGFRGNKNYTQQAGHVLYKNELVPGADAASFQAGTAGDFSDMGVDRNSFYFGTTTIGSVQDVVSIQPPTFATSTHDITLVRRQALVDRSANCAGRAEDSGCGYRVFVTYPQLAADSSGVSSVVIDRINTQLHTKYEDLFQEKVTEDAPHPQYSAGNMFEGVYRPSSLPFITFRFRGDQYTGGAHPYGGGYVETFDLLSGKKLSTEDVFLKDTDYPRKIHTYLDEAYFMEAQSSVSGNPDNGYCLPSAEDPSLYTSERDVEGLYVADAGLVVGWVNNYPCGEETVPVVIPFSFLKENIKLK